MFRPKQFSHSDPKLTLWLIAVVLVFAGSCSTPTQRNSTVTPPANASVGEQTLSGRVVRVADGDTITVLDSTNAQHRIRLSGIDAPESHQAFGSRSKENLADLVFGKDVTVLYSKSDQYGRLVGKIIVNGQDVNLEQVKAGMAWHYKEYEREQSPEDRRLYARAEEDARAQRRGLWQDPNPIEPSEFRREEKERL